MHTVYVLRSLKNGSLYVGITDRLAEERLIEHNNGKTSSISNRRPFVLVYTETMASRDLAIKRERFLKSGKGRKVLQNLARAGWKSIV